MSNLLTLKTEVAKIIRPAVCMNLYAECRLDKDPSDTLWWAKPKLLAFADKIGYKVQSGDPSVVFPWREAKEIRENDSKTLHGVCDRRTRQIIIEPSPPEDFQVRTIVHELAHALGANSWDEGTDEITAESTAFLVTQQLGYNSLPFTLPYVAFNHWEIGGIFVDEDINHYTNKIMEVFQ